MLRFFEKHLLPHRRKKNFLLEAFFFLYDFRVAWIIRNSNLFCCNWYVCTNLSPEQMVLKTYRIRGISVPVYSKLRRFLSHPIFHYVRKGVSLGYAPTVFFDGERYLDHYPAVRAAQLNPFYHYIRYGAVQGYESAGRIVLPLPELPELRAATGNRLGIADIGRQEFANLPPAGKITETIAVHLHLFYPQMTEYFISHLKAIPVPFDLYLSVCDSTISPERFRSSLPNLNQLVMEEVPNRGRNIAPLVAFGKRLTAYDFVCHIHSKQSPHSTALQNWPREMLDTLLGSEERVARILTLLKQDGKFFFAAPHPEAEPDPATGWSCNYDPAETILRRHTSFRISAFPVIDFPHGAMFWARGKALERLARLPFTPEDFPAEPIPPDGTLAHTLERLLLLLASDIPGKAYKAVTE